jgi:PAS domain-containing protein
MSENTLDFEKHEYLCNIALNELPIYVFWKDRNLVFQGCNIGFANYIGLSSPAEIVGKTDFDLADRETAEHFREIDMKVIETKKPIYNITEIV